MPDTTTVLAIGDTGFPTDQIYTLVNNIVSQSIGETSITATDAQSLISLGDLILNGNNLTEGFLNTLAMRISRTIYSFREYRNKYRDMVLSDSEYGAITQKIKVKMPVARIEDSIPLEDGQPAPDQWIIAKPKATQKMFYKRTPYSYVTTIQRKWLREAFNSPAEMGSFIGLVFGETRNAIELGLENLARTCINNFMAESTHEVKLVTLYNNALNPTTPLTAATAIYNTDFLAFAIKTIRSYIYRMEDMSVLYNDGSETRHTPRDLQRILMSADFMLSAETVLQRQSFNDNFVELPGYKTVSFWQSQETPNQIIVERASDGEETTISNIVGCIHDRDALGMYRIEEEIATTPVNARVLTYNTWYHENQVWINDLSENFIYFTLN